jgi:hypothetical protein
MTCKWYSFQYLPCILFFVFASQEFRKLLVKIGIVGSSVRLNVLNLGQVLSATTSSVGDATSPGQGVIPSDAQEAVDLLF